MRLQPHSPPTPRAGAQVMFLQDRAVFPIRRGRLIHSGPGEGGAALSDHTMALWARPRTAAAPDPARAHGGLRAGKSRVLFWFRETAGLPAWEGGSRVASSVAKAPLRLISYPSVTHRLPIISRGLEIISRAGGGRGNSGVPASSRAGRGGGGEARGAGFSPPWK